MRAVSCAAAVLAYAAGAAAQSGGQGEWIPFGPIVSQVPLPECEIAMVCNGQACADVCVEGSVVVDPWYTATLGFQRDLQGDRPLNVIQWVGTHNAFISRANGMGLTEDLAQNLFPRTAPYYNTTVRV
jgi:hypothetical protein